MSNFSLLLEHEQFRVAKITDSLMTDVNEFRQQAHEAFTAYSSDKRKIIEGLEKSSVRAYDFFISWEHRLNNHTPDSDLLFEIYPGKKYKKQRKRAAKLLEQPDKDILSLKNIYTETLLYRHIAKKHRISLIDPGSLWLCQSIVRLFIHHQNQRLGKYRTKRLESITRQLETLGTMDGGLIDSIVKEEIDIVQILAARSKCEKQVGRLSDADARNPVKRIGLYEELVDDLREKYGQLLAKKEIPTYTASYTKMKTFDDIALRIFDMNNSQKNALLTHMKEYRELNKEKDALVHSLPLKSTSEAVQLSIFSSKLLRS